VNANCGKVRSSNFGAMKACKAPSGGKAGLLTLSLPGARCANPRCCHNALATKAANAGWLGQARAQLEALAGR